MTEIPLTADDDRAIRHGARGYPPSVAEFTAAYEIREARVNDEGAKP